jgi:peptidoglycan/LPS O-acetylase OafA/YrhL
MTAILTDRERSALADAAGRSGAVAADRFVPALTGVRAFAALWVVAHHLWLNAHAPPLRILGVDLAPLFAAGWFGVDVFFVLSGFLLTQQAIADDRRRGERGGRAPGYGAFLSRRILRVFPAYYACLTALILFPAFRGEPYVPAPTTPDLALHLVMMHNAVSAYLPTINGVFWSLPFEFQFYLVMPLLAIAVLRGRTGTLLALALATSLAARAIVVVSGSGRMLELLPFRIDEFVAGMAAAALATDPRAARHRGALFGAGFALLFAMAAYFGARRIPWWTPDLWPTVRTWCVAGGTALMLAGLARGARTGTRVLGHPAVVWLGEISYSIYLWHLPVLVYLYQHVAWFDRLRGVPLARPLAAAGAIVAVSAASYYVVERPFHSGALSARRLGRGAPIAFAILAAWALALLALNAR